MISLADRRHAPLILVLLGLGLSLGFEFHRQKPLIWTPENSRRDFLAGVVAGTSVLGFSTAANADPRNGYYELANARLYDTARRSYLPADPALQRALPDRLAGVRCVVVGEAHTHPLHHRLELQVVEALHALADPETAPLAVGLEMFYRQHQAALDRYVFRGGTLGQLRRETDWDRTWGFSFAAYSKIFRYAQLNGIRLVGLNAPGALVSLVGKSGIDGLPPQLKELLPEMDLNNKQHKDRFMNKMQSLAALHGGGQDDERGPAGQDVRGADALGRVHGRERGPVPAGPGGGLRRAAGGAGGGEPRGGARRHPRPGDAAGGRRRGPRLHGGAAGRGLGGRRAAGRGRAARPGLRRLGLLHREADRGRAVGAAGGAAAAAAGLRLGKMGEGRHSSSVGTEERK
ncbi:unnamed protein product [Heterosigma akashiwo]